MYFNEETRKEYMGKYVVADAYFNTGVHYGFSFGQVTNVHSHVCVKYYKDNLMVSRFIEPSTRNIRVIEGLREIQARMGSELVEFMRKFNRVTGSGYYIENVKCFDNEDGTFHVDIVSKNDYGNMDIRSFVIGKRGGLKTWNNKGNLVSFKLDWSIVQ